MSDPSRCPVFEQYREDPRWWLWQDMVIAELLGTTPRGALVDADALCKARQNAKQRAEAQTIPLSKESPASANAA